LPSLQSCGLVCLIGRCGVDLQTLWSMAPEAAGKARPSGVDVARGLCEEILTEEFFEKHWERTPLHFRSADRGRTANRLPEALSTDDIMALIRKSGHSLKMFRHGEASDLDNFMVAYLEGASMIVNQADRCNSTLFELCKALAKVHFMHVFCVVYLTPPGSQAVRLHNDDQDVFLLQVCGRKRWTIRNAPKLLPYTEEMMGKDVPVPEELVGEPTMEFTMEPHDVLYIPRGYLHEAATGEEPSLHITVTIPTSDYCWGVQLIKHFMQELSTNKQEEGSLLQSSLSSKAPSSSEEALEDKLKGVLNSWAEGVQVSSVLDAFEQRMARTNEGQERQFARLSDMKSAPLVTEDSRVRLMSGVSSCQVVSELAVFVREADGQRLDLPIARSAAPMLRALTHRPQPVPDLPCADPFERLCVLQMLHQQGVLQLFVSPSSQQDADDLREGGDDYRGGGA